MEVPASQSVNRVPSAVFSEEERVFTRMLDERGVLVGDRWFPAHSPELERARYLVSYHRRLERNRRRRERRRAHKGAPKPRNVRGRVAIDMESQRANRLLLERRKCLRRATLARCPTPNEIRTAYRFRNVCPSSKLRLGGMLLDLECYVDNSLKVIGKGDAVLIVGRRKGILGWIRENCPELVAKYKTMMRFRALAKNFRQDLDVQDPIPTSVLLDPSIPLQDLVGAPLQIQPRGNPDEDDAETVRNRFVWETSRIRFDANGREFRENENYWLISHTAGYVIAAAGHLSRAREGLAQIILNGTGKCAIENYVRGLGAIPSRAPARGAAGAGADVLREIVESQRRRQRGFAGKVEAALVAWLDLPYRATHLPVTTPEDLRDE